MNEKTRAIGQQAIKLMEKSPWHPGETRAMSLGVAEIWEMTPKPACAAIAIARAKIQLYPDHDGWEAEREAFDVLTDYVGTSIVKWNDAQPNKQAVIKVMKEVFA